MRTHACSPLFHFSEDATIARFEPRPSHRDPAGRSLVWAIDEAHAPLYYVPRDCPRVAFQAAPHSTPADVERFLAHTSARWVMAIEGRWLQQMRETRLYAYHLPAATFTCIDEGAGYFVSEQAVSPLAVELVGDLLERCVAAGVELRITPSLWPLYRAVAASSLQFSILRMRNAWPEDEPVRRHT